MIVPMKKISVIVQAKDAESALRGLRKLGVLHVQHQQPPKGSDVSRLQDEFSAITQALDILSGAGAQPGAFLRKEKAPPDYKLLARRILDCHKRISQLIEYSNAVKQMIGQWQDWGDFEPEKIEELKKSNVLVSFFRMRAVDFKNLPGRLIAKKISARGGIVNCAIISREKIDLPFKEISPPKMGLQKMRDRLSYDLKTIELLKEELKTLFPYYDKLAAIRQALAKDMEFHEALAGMGAAGELAYISGFAPVDAVSGVKKAAAEARWAVLVSEPMPEDYVPTFIRNPRWISIISPIFKFLDILPGYRELDISLPFLIFFSIFFGILIGDAGYGLTYAVITYILHRRARKKGWDTSPFFLFYILSFCAVVWGLFTGTFFGQEWFLKAGYQPLIPGLNDKKNFQRFCFFLGALHLSLAHAWRGILKAPSLNALGDLGWMCILWSAFFIAKTLILGDAFPSFCTWLLVSGVALIILFTNPRKNILKSAEEWIAWLVTLPLNFMSNFADVVSYIRLFAVGLAGVAIADAFNALAATIGKGNVFMILLAVLVALIGNTLGVVLGPVSVLVHGVRLNVLEFSLHGNISWSGTRYRPLQE